MSNKKRFLRNIALILIFCLTLNVGYLTPNASKAEEGDPYGLKGSWYGTITIKGTSFPIIVDIDIANADSFEGISTIDDGHGGRFLIQGTLAENNDIEIKTTWVYNPQEADNWNISGKLSKSSSSKKIEGSIYDKAYPNSSIQLKYNPDLTRFHLEPYNIPKFWFGEFLGYHRKAMSLNKDPIWWDWEIQIDEDGIKKQDSQTCTLQGILFVTPSKSRPEAETYPLRSISQITLSLNLRTGEISIQDVKNINRFPMNNTPDGYEKMIFTECGAKGIVIQQRNSSNPEYSILGDTDAIPKLTKTEDTWTMRANDFKRVNNDHESGFTLERDNNWFKNTDKEWGKNNYHFIEENDAVTKNSDGEYNLNKYYDKLKSLASYGEEGQIKELMDNPWGGSCYGISATMGLLYNHIIKIDDLKSRHTTDTYYERNIPLQDDPKFYNTINYYFLTQIIVNHYDSYISESSTYDESFDKIKIEEKKGTPKKDPLPIFLHTLVNNARLDHCVSMFNYKTKLHGGHSVLITGCKFDENAGTNKEGEYVVEIYDMNHKMNYQYMHITKDYTNFYFEKSYDENGHEFEYDLSNEGDNKYLKMHIIDIDTFKDVLLDNLTTSGIKQNKTENKASSNHMFIKVPMNKTYTIKNSSQKSLSYDGNSFSGDMTIYSINSSGNENEAKIVFETDKSSRLELSELGSAVDIGAFTKDSYMSLSGSSIDSATINFRKGITLRGNNYTFDAHITTGKMDNGEKGFISLSGKATSDTELMVNKIGVDVKSANSITDVVTKSYIGANMTKRAYTNVDTKFNINTEAKTDSGEEVQITPTDDKNDISNATITIPSSVKIGKKNEPAIVIKIGDKTLTQGTDYSISYRGNKGIGTATATITGIGDYHGTVTRSFDILPVGTKISKLKSKKKAIVIRWKKGSGSITGYEIQYADNKSFSKAKQKLIKKKKTTKVKISSLKWKKTYYIRIRTYKTVNGKKYCSSWSKAVASKTK